jgi:hypothetical protein
MDSNANPHVKIIEGKGVGVHFVAHNASRVERHVRTIG